MHERPFYLQFFFKLHKLYTHPTFIPFNIFIAILTYRRPIMDNLIYEIARISPILFISFIIYLLASFVKKGKQRKADRARYANIIYKTFAGYGENNDYTHLQENMYNYAATLLLKKHIPYVNKYQNAIKKAPAIDHVHYMSQGKCYAQTEDRKPTPSQCVIHVAHIQAAFYYKLINRFYSLNLFSVEAIRKSNKHQEALKDIKLKIRQLIQKDENQLVDQNYTKFQYELETILTGKASLRKLRLTLLKIEKCIANAQF